MLFAIVDIETTGGYAAASRITEVAIFIHNGSKVVQKFETLVNPECEIPYYITGLTGISEKMVRKAPTFEKVAKRIYNLLHDKVFVAHSVNFDYSFLKNQLDECGYKLDTQKLCTIRLSRKVISGLSSYSLGNICGYLNINITNRHRAGGDAIATVKLFEYIMANGGESIISASLKRNSKEQVLPPNVPKEQFDNLPRTTGIYYFHNKQGKVVYVGKAVNIKSRVSSHFSGTSSSRQRQNFMREVFHISYKGCADEQSAFALEDLEIKRLWPKFNIAQKHYVPTYGLIEYTDQNGFRRLGIERLKKKQGALTYFNNRIQAIETLKENVSSYGLCLRLSGLAKSKEACVENDCICCTNGNTTENYNKLVSDLIFKLKIDGQNMAATISNPLNPALELL
ncbi:MAG: exonuclease domain-containing protein [Chitinophagales bacterium]